MRTLGQGFGRRVWFLLAASAALAAPGYADPTAVVDEDGHFAATFPAAVTRDNHILDTDAGQVIQCQVSAVQGAMSFVVIYCDYPEGYVAGTGVPAVYKSAAKDVAGNAKGTIRKQDDCKLGDTAGLEVVIDGPNRGFVQRTRLFIIGDRLFQVTYVGRPDSEGGKPALDFLDSFRLHPAPASK
jgi:hypothetical protein